jgi:hemerythrin
MDPTEISYLLEEEKKKCIEKMKSYYNKYGDKSLQTLVDYLQYHIENNSDEEIKKQLQDDIKILNTYL